MEPITAAIIALLPALGAETVKQAVLDAYAGLKAVIRSKWGDSAPLSKAISALEENPTSKGQALVLEENAIASRAMSDPEVAQALRDLVTAMKESGTAAEAVSRIEVNLSHATVTNSIVGSHSVKIDTFSPGTTHNQ